MSNNNQQEHIPISSTGKGEESEQKGTGGLLSNIGDPIGRFPAPSTSTLKITDQALYIGSTLNTALRPVGAPLEKVTGSLGNAVGGVTKPALGPLMGNKEERMEVVGGDNKDSYKHKEEKIGGKEQTGDNPLGLDQTGRWGFRD